MSLPDKLRRVPPVVWIGALAVTLLFPLLGTFGFWDPWELAVAERARDVLRSGRLLDPAVGGRAPAEPPLDLLLAAVGMKLFGARELGARLANALCAALALYAVYWAGAGLFRRRAGLLAAVVLATTPLFLLQARQLTSDMPLIAGLALASGGLGRYAWPSGGRRRGRDLLVALVGLVMGTLSGGALLGAALPCLALAGALVVGWGLKPGRGSGEDRAGHDLDRERPPLADPGVGPHVPADKTFGQAVRAKGWGTFLLVALVGVGLLVATLTTANVAGQYSWLLGGVPRIGTPPQKFDYLVRQLGFGLFPWSAIAVFALGRALVRLAEEDPHGGGRLAFAQVHLLVLAAFAFALTSLYVLMVGDARFPALAAVALAIGAFLDEALEGERSEPVLGLLAATGTMVVARDFFLAPEELVSVHLLQKVKWPPTFKLGPLFLAVGAVVAGGIYLGLATRGRALGRVALRDLGEAGAWRRKLERVVVEAGRYGIQAALAGAVLFALLVTYLVVPTISRHVSWKPVIESYRRFAETGEPIGKYRVQGHGSAFYTEGEMVELPTQERVVEFLKQPRRAFALVASEELAALDAALKLAAVAYVVLDASSARFLLLSNRVEPGERDSNPLKQNVWMAPRPPRLVTTGAEKTWEWPPERPPWPPPSVQAGAVFGDAIELLGADFPAVVRRPGKIRLELHFRVQEKPPPGYMIFVHIETPGETRLLGDHTPLNGTFPTVHWLAGEYIKDFVEVDVPYMTTAAGTYTVLVGFWPGGDRKRLPITAGLNDGGDRARLGTIRIR
jgi:hypothetical protein